MLKKTRAGETGKVRVTFILSARTDAHHVHVVGDFNGWQNTTPMKRQKDRSWRATVELLPGREYQFRYLVDGNQWLNDDAADGYPPGPFGADNSLVRVEQAESKPAPARAGAAKSAPSGAGASGRGGKRGGSKRAGKAAENGAGAAGKGGGRGESSPKRS